VIYFCYIICPSFSYPLWSLTSSAGILVLISCWNSGIYGDSLLYWGLAYVRRVFHLAYVHRHNVSVPAGSGRYIVVSEPRFTPGVGNHLGQYSGSYQQYSQVQINWSVSEFRDSSNEYKNTMTLTIHSLTRLYSSLPSSCRPEHLISFTLSLHRLTSHPLGLGHYHTSPSWVPYRYQSAQRKCRGPVPFRLWGWKYCSLSWFEIARTQFL